MKAKRGLVVMSVLILMATQAAAQPSAAPYAPTPPPKDTRNLSVMVSPVHLLLPFVELTVEKRGGDQWSIAGIVGGGEILDISIYEVGAQLNYYVVGSFNRGFQIGAEAIYMYASSELGDTRAAAEGLSIGPYAGYKIATQSGFTFNVQAGIQLIGVAGKDSSGTTSEAESTVQPLVNLNVGWTF